MKLSRNIRALINDDPFTIALIKPSEKATKAMNKLAFTCYGWHSLDFLRKFTRIVLSIPDVRNEFLTDDEAQAIKDLAEHCGGFFTTKFLFELYAWFGHSKRELYIGLLAKFDDKALSQFHIKAPSTIIKVL